MALLDDLVPKRRKRNCSFALVFNDLTLDEQQKVTEIMESIGQNEGRYTASWLATQLTKNGHFTSHGTILRHARKQCCCA
jgi:GTP-sensing pleiotropic transcriptional regulator CodY